MKTRIVYEPASEAKRSELELVTTTSSVQTRKRATTNPSHLLRSAQARQASMLLETARSRLRECDGSDQSHVKVRCNMPNGKKIDRWFFADDDVRCVRDFLLLDEGCDFEVSERSV